MRYSTRQMVRPELSRWFYRTSKGDFGPVSTDELLEAIKSRHVDLGSEVKRLGAAAWGVAGDERIFRDHYAKCRAHWDEQELHAETDRLGVKLKRAHTRRKGAWIVMVVGALAVIGAAALLWWRLSRAEPLGVARLISTEEVGALPLPIAKARDPVGYPRRPIHREPLLAEVELLDTAGVRVGGLAAPIAQRFEFDEAGEVAEIPPAVLATVTETARQGLVLCAHQLAKSNAAFAGTEVSFSVTSGRIANIAVGKEVAGSAGFRACVKSALTRVSVPKFQGNARRVTVPLKLGR